jgi:hypothetical protein
MLRHAAADVKVTRAAQAAAAISAPVAAALLAI